MTRVEADSLNFAVALAPVGTSQGLTLNGWPLLSSDTVHWQRAVRALRVYVRAAASAGKLAAGAQRHEGWPIKCRNHLERY